MRIFALRPVSMAVAFLASIGQALPATQLTPLPLEDAVRLHTHNWPLGVDLSPDGSWVTRSYSVDGDTLERASKHFTVTGSTLAFGASRLQSGLTEIASGETITLGATTASTWGAVWSPDSQRVAYFSDEGGEAGVWIWERATRKAWRFPNVTARAWHATHSFHWLPDSKRVVCKVLPEDMTLAEANAIGPRASVNEGNAHKKTEGEAIRVLVSPESPKSAVSEEISGFTMDFLVGDIAILDSAKRTAVRIASHKNVLFYNLSPDRSQIAFSHTQRMKTEDASTIKTAHGILIYDIPTGKTHEVAQLTLRSVKWSWSPDSKFIAFFADGVGEATNLLVVNVASGKQRVLGGKSAPAYRVWEDSIPIWSADSAAVFAIGSEKLWRMPIAGGATAIAANAGYRFYSIVSASDSDRLWSGDVPDVAWVVGAARDDRQGLLAVNLKKSTVEPAFLEDASFVLGNDVDASSQARRIAYVLDAQNRKSDLLVYDLKTRTSKLVNILDPALSAHAMGSSRVVEWWSATGQELKGALLLPPDYKPGKRLPLVVWVYGTAYGSRNVNTYGLAGDLPVFNMQVLATRGYAVLYPDAPVRTGTTSKDLLDTVMPGVDAVIASGYADAERLAVMGTSYGSYCVFALITQTPRFKAAVASAVTYQDYLTGYLAWNTPAAESGSTGYYEHGQANMGGTPWTHRERYIENSPIWLFDKIQTPVMMAHGSEDFLSLEAPGAAFLALKRLGKRAELIIYKGEGHAIEQHNNVIDFWQRRLEFLAEHLTLQTDAEGKVHIPGA